MAEAQDTAYAGQDRGEAGAYDRYLAGMDASMRQKVALTAAHLLSEGEVADMGMGSGSGSFALASLYPQLQVIGVDVNPTMVERARERYPLPNLRFQVGDIAEPCFEAGMLEAILDSSVLHHVTSFNGYAREAAGRALEIQAAQLAEQGVLIVRDFLDPGPGRCWLDLPADDGDDSEDPRSNSSAALFERFAREFRSLRDPAQRGFPYERREGSADQPLPPGWRRYALERVHAVEFVLRKDYRADWELEVQEEYTYLSQAEFEALFARLGLRVLASTPIRNPWIVRNRFQGKFAWRDAGGQALDVPATNYVVVGQKVPAGEGVRFVESGPAEPVGFLELSHYRRDDGRVYDLVRRPGLTLDLIPWFEQEGSIHVLARRSYPRPILASRSRGSLPLDGSQPASYVTEPLCAIQGDKPAAQTAEELLGEFPDLGAAALRRFEPGGAYYLSPGGLQEEVRSLFIAIDPVNVQSPHGSRSGFSTSGLLRAIEARQLLRAAQVGALPDARLELNVYDLLLRRGLDAGAWIGAALALEQEAPPPETTHLEALAQRPPRRRFRRCGGQASGGFLQVHCAEFEERDAQDTVLHRRPLEFVVPGPLSCNTIAVALLRRAGDEVLFALDDDDLPAAQCFTGHSHILVTPAWRLPRDVQGIAASRAWTRARVEAEYALELGETWELGGRYHPSAGVTPEVVYPLALEVRGQQAGARPLAWVPLGELVRGRAQLRDGHLRVLALRAAHALGLLSERS